MMRSALAEAADGFAPHRGETRVRPFTTPDAAQWDRFVELAPSGTFFHRAAWRSIIENVFGHRCHYLLAEAHGQVCGVLPLAEIRSTLFGHSLVSLPFCVYGGPVAGDERTQDALIDAAVQLGRELRVQHLELRNRRPIRATWPRQDLYVTFRKRLEPDADANMKAIPRKQRAMVRKGIGHGLRSEVDRSAERFFDLYADNVHRHGTPGLSRRYFDALLATFSDACEVLTIVDPRGRPVSGVLSFYFRDEVLPYYAGDTSRARELAANDFKYWELMRRACERGSRVFDYGRSKRGTGSYDFKKNWGFDPSPLAYEHTLYVGKSVPQKNPLNPKYRVFIELWRRLPRPLAIALGPMVVRNLG
jgi:FemAB-related protein (PEP-CTERM system-associated)